MRISDWSSDVCSSDLFRSDEAVNDPAVTVDAFGEQTNATAVRIEPGDDARELIPHLDRLRLIEVNFPAWTDGRGYSSARVLREAGFDGAIRAVSDVVIDMLRHLKRCARSEEHTSELQSLMRSSY